MPLIRHAHSLKPYPNGYVVSSVDLTVSDSSLIANNRIALFEIRPSGNTKMQVSLWSRNSLNKEHKFHKSRGGFAEFGAFGKFNLRRN